MLTLQGENVLLTGGADNKVRFFLIEGIEVSRSQSGHNGERERSKVEPKKSRLLPDGTAIKSSTREGAGNKNFYYLCFQIPNNFTSL